MKSVELRQKFLKFFQNKEHKIIPSASLVPSESVDLAPTQRVLFTTAGMHPLVPYLLGQPHPEGSRLVNVQKCLRTDDIDQVGDNVHNTFFEMLGNWSLGDPASPDGVGLGGYWKEEAITWSYQFLIDVLKLDAKRIYVSVFAGDEDAPFDEESFTIWKRLGVRQDHIFKYGKDQNWWGPVGQAGPCGPDTEMFYDLDPSSGAVDPAKDPNRFVEIWNDVFMEYDRQIKNQKSKIKNFEELKPDDFKYLPLKQKNVDTGMGLERILAILQGKNNIYETDLFAEAIKGIESKSTKFDLRKARIIADHTRASTFLISDGIKPYSADEKGSVLVRLLTKSMALGKELGIEGTFLSWLSDLFINIYKNHYQDLEEKRDEIDNIISQEETRYAQRSLTWIPVQEQAIKNVLQRYKEEKDRQSLIAGTAITVSGIDWNYNDLQKKFPTITSTASGAIGTVSADLKMSQGIPVEETFRKAEQIVKDFDLSEAEMNLGVMNQLHREASKSKTQKSKGGLAVQSDKAAKLHTATHLLHQALRDLLGSHVHQTGSHITEERLRFDFSHDNKMTDEEIKKVEQIVNRKIADNLKVNKKIMPKSAADQLGAIGLFDEKYPELVNVYYIGQSEKVEDAYSKEFCGGPHADSTGVLGRFKIIKEESAGSGVRRIYATIKTNASE